MEEREGKEDMKAGLRQSRGVGAVTELAGDMGRDFQNPLAAIRVYTHLVLKELGRHSGVHRNMKRIHGACIWLVSMKNRLCRAVSDLTTRFGRCYCPSDNGMNQQKEGTP